jgi:hypothetical protein
MGRAWTAVVIAFVSAAWCLWLPMLVASWQGVYYEAGVVDRLPADVRARLDAATQRDRARDQARRALEARIEQAAASGQDSPEAVAALTDLKAALESPAIEGETGRVIPSACHLSEVMLVILWAYIVLAMLMLGKESRLREGRWWLQTPLLGLAMMIFFNWPHWLRNSVWDSSGRTVYSCFNLDIDPWSFGLQEFRLLGFCTLLAAVSTSRIFDGKQWKAQRSLEGSPAKACVDVAHRATEVFIRWQKDSLLLAVACLPITWFYWRLIVDRGDPRYLPSAVNIHLLWIGAWVCVSVPLVSAWRAWMQSRANLLENQVSSRGVSLNGIPAMDFLKGLEPINQARFVGVAIAGLLSLLLPLLQAVS